MVVAGTASVKASASENQKNLNNLVCRDSHHHEMALIFICQDLGYKDGLLKTLRINSHYIVVFTNHNDCTISYRIAGRKFIPKHIFQKNL